MKTVPSDDPLHSLSSPHRIRQRLSRSLIEADVLKRMLKVAERRTKLLGDCPESQPVERQGAQEAP